MIDFVKKNKNNQKILKQQIAKYVIIKKRSPLLVIIQVGKNEASNRYIKNKCAACSIVGIKTRIINFDNDVSEQEIRKTINHLNKELGVDGIIVQLPLPSHLPEGVIINTVAPAKDVDGFTSANLGKLILNLDNGFYPATVLGVINSLMEITSNLEGMAVLVIGQSNIVGKPLAIWLINQGATVTSANRFTKNLKHLTLQADIIITATGVPGLISHDMVQKNVAIIDVGIAYCKDGVVGDVKHSDLITKKANYITPVPNGIGLLTVSNLMQNVVKAYIQSTN